MDTFEQLGDVVNKVLSAIRQVDVVWLVWRHDEAILDDKLVTVENLDSIYLTQEEAEKRAMMAEPLYYISRVVHRDEKRETPMDTVFIVWTNDVEEVGGEKIRIPVIHALYDSEEGARDCVERQKDARLRQYWYDAYPVNSGGDNEKG